LPGLQKTEGEVLVKKLIQRRIKNLTSYCGVIRLQMAFIDKWDAVTDIVVSELNSKKSLNKSYIIHLFLLQCLKNR
jgi:hypothetical protein